MFFFCFLLHSRLLPFLSWVESTLNPLSCAMDSVVTTEFTSFWRISQTPPFRNDFKIPQRHVNPTQDPPFLHKNMLHYQSDVPYQQPMSCNMELLAESTAESFLLGFASAGRSKVTPRCKTNGQGTKRVRPGFPYKSTGSCSQELISASHPTGQSVIPGWV